MKLWDKYLIIFLVIILLPASAYAVPVIFEFEGNISYAGAEWESLLSTGDPIYGSAQFDFSPPTALGAVSGPTEGNYTVPSGTVSCIYSGAAQGEEFAQLRWMFGSGPSVTIGTEEYELTGFNFVARNINGFESTLEEYLALGTSDFDVEIVGEIHTGGATYFRYFDVSLTSASLQQVPEPTSFLLLGVGLIGLAGLSRKKFKR